MIDLHSLSSETLNRFLQRSKASAALPEEPDMSLLVRQILEKAAELVPSESGAILLDDPLSKGSDRSRNRLHFVSVFGPAAEGLNGVAIPASEGVAGHVYTTGKPYLSSDTGVDERFTPAIDKTTGYSTRSIIAAPILIGPAVCGTIELLNREDGEPYEAHDLLLLQVFASYTASSIQNALDARQAQGLAKMDDLTGLYNDRYLHVRLREELSRIQGDDGRCALFFMDLDHFKPINDMYGHLVGSQVLREVGYLLRRAADGHGAILARYGGDEFTLLLPGHSAQEAAPLAESVRATIANAVFLERSRGKDLPALGLEGIVTASIGVADVRGSDMEIADAARSLLRRADQAMYRAKDHGGDRVVIWEDQSDSASGE